MLLGAVSNALDVQFIPDKIRDVVADWDPRPPLEQPDGAAARPPARRAGTLAQLAGASAFRATEAALGVAASELFAALPEEYPGRASRTARNRRGARSARRGSARRDRRVAALAASGSDDSEVLDTRRNAASAHLAASVGALERIRLDLFACMRARADLAPLTTLIEEAHLLSDDARRLAEAEQEVEDAIERRYS